MQTKRIPKLAKSSADIEDTYLRQSDREHRKKFGQVFTPVRVSELMADWVCEPGPSSVVDPAFGTGVLARAVWAKRPEANILGFEVDPIMYQYAANLGYRSLDLQLADFLKVEMAEVEGLIANPPYIRHRELVGADIARNRLSVRAGYTIPKSANIYIYFCTKIILELAIGGRASIIIPSEWLNANFSTGFKSFLKDSGCLQHIVSFSHCSDLFHGALTTASVLLLEKK